jgi:hypothetical protein
MSPAGPPGLTSRTRDEEDTFEGDKVRKVEVYFGWDVE